MQLQISTVNVSQLGKNTRLDPEYYSPNNLSLNDQITSINYSVVDDIATVTDGIHTSINFSDTSKVNLISAMSPKDNYFDTSKTGYIDETQHKANPRTQLKENDIILSTVGTIGNCAVVDESVLPANSDRHVGIIRLKNKDWKPRFISTFLLSKYGRFQTLRESTGNVQLNLFIDKIRTLTIPSASNQLQNTIESLVSDATKKRLESADKLTESNQTLISHLGFADFTPSTVNYSSRSSKEPIETGRFDGEYWLPMYDEIEMKIDGYPHGYDAFDNLIEVSSETISPNADETYKYAELSNVIASIGLIEDASEMYGNELPSRARMKLRKDDVVLSSVEGSADKVAIVKVENNNLVGSTGFFVLRNKHLLPEVILALLRIPHINAIYKRQAQGTILTAVPRSSLSRIMLPKIPESFQQGIASQVQEAHKLHNESKQLLEVAKRAVEVFIEQDEEAALEYIKQNYDNK